MTPVFQRTIPALFLFAILSLFSSCQPEKEEETKKESFEVFKKIFAIGLPGMKDEEIAKVEGVRVLDGSKASTPGLVIKTDAIVTDGPLDSLHGVSINGFSKDGVITSSRIEIEDTTEFLEDIRSLVESHYQIKFPEAELDEMNLGETTMKMKTYKLDKDGMAYRVFSYESNSETCGFDVKPLSPKQE